MSTVLHRVGDKEIRGIVVSAQKAGWDVRYGGTGHLKFYDPAGRLVTSAPATPGDRRSSKNLVAHLRREGLEVRSRPLKKKEQSVTVAEEAPSIFDQPKADNKPTTVVRGLLRSHPGEPFDTRMIAERTGLTPKQVQNALGRSINMPGFLRLERGRYMFEPKTEEVRVTHVEPAPAPESEPEAAEPESAPRPLRVRTSAERRRQWAVDEANAVDRLAEAEAQARAEGRAELPTSFEVVTTDWLGRLVLRDEFGEVWMAAPVRADV